VQDTLLRGTTLDPRRTQQKRTSPERSPAVDRLIAEIGN
jgi:hypothetical protein